MGLNCDSNINSYFQSFGASVKVHYFLLGGQDVRYSKNQIEISKFTGQRN